MQLKQMPWVVIVLTTMLHLSCDPQSMQKLQDVAANNSPAITEQQIADALKEALTIGVRHGVQYLGKRDGFYRSPYKIVLPEEAQGIVQKVRRFPAFRDAEEKLLLKINRSAELAMQEAEPIFVDAIQKMTIRDAMRILKGNRDAATQYLRVHTESQLVEAFKPVIVRSLQHTGVLTLWNKIVKTYNAIPLVEKRNPHLEDYIAQKAVDALFDRIRIEESRIRSDVHARTTELLKKVFALQD